MKKLVLILLSVLSVTAFSQTFRFNRYTTEDGISQNFIYSINQDAQGYLWVGTGEGLCRFDGKHFETFTTLDGLAEDVITCSYSDKDGNQWFGHNEGGVTKFNGREFSEIPNSKPFESQINDLDGFGESIFGISQNEGLFEIKDDRIIPIGTFNQISFHTIKCIDENNILLGTFDGLVHIMNNGSSWLYQEIYLEGYMVNDIAPSSEKGVFLLGMNQGGLARCRLNNGKIQISEWDGEFNFEEIQIQKVMEDNENNIWIGTYGHGLIKFQSDSTAKSDFEVTQYSTQTGMSSDFVQTIYQDREENIWVGSFGAGLSTLIDDFFTFYSFKSTGFNNNVSAIWVSGQERWYGTQNGIIRYSPTLDSNVVFYNGKNGFVNDQVTAFYESDSIIWIGTGQSGLYSYDLRKSEMTRIPWNYGSLHNMVTQITGMNGSIYVATEGGLIVYYISNQSTNLFDTREGLAHNSIKSICAASDGTIYLGTHSRFLYGIKNSAIEEYEITTGGELVVNNICEDKNGTIWAGTAEHGIYKMTEQGFEHYSTENGLKSNYSYSLSTDNSGIIWVGHRGGLSKINPLTNKVKVFDQKSGIEDKFNDRATWLDDKYYLWFGTDGGAVKYDPSKDNRVSIPPVTNLISIVIENKVYGINKAIDLPYDDYKVQFNFIGISFKDPDKVKYKYMLKGHDKDFSDFTSEPSVTYGSLKDGEYEFLVMACTEDGACSQEISSVTITVASPFWKQAWFYVLVSVILVGGVFLFVRIRLQRQKTIQEYLEYQLEKKTKEVVEKADIIQEINKDLTSSIKYAERIQASILPNTDEFLDAFPNSFIFFRPRDVVSGDFYFIRKYPDRYVIACCDCTGHGVPGAFMSMIGSTTLRNIYKLMESTGKCMNPAEVLDLLDEEIQIILQQRSDDEEDEYGWDKSKDGMDMTLVEINLESKEIQLSSAKRHSFWSKQGEVEMVLGDKRPIGGGEIGKIDFTVQKFQYEEGDALYLFSDGYPDQFGGETGRKLKLAGTQKIIEGLNGLDRSEYYNSIESNFTVWKSDRDQIDDVLMIGILF